MSTASSASAVGPAEPHVVPTRLRRPRDVRLDFFRGLGMFIIFVSHVPHNIWANVIPARFGFSDATEIFVFCSGMASALAFGRMFDESGLIPGLSRIAHRCWQVYWAHIGVFLVSASLLIGADYLLATGGHYLSTSSIAPFFGPDTPMYLVGLLTLSYVPGLFNILPMYLVILALIPFVVWLGRYGRLPVAAFVLSLYAVGTSGIIDFGGDPLAPEVWFFNPFAWQLVFFTGFAFMRGWIPAPPVDHRLIIAALLVVVVLIPLANPLLVESSDSLRAGNQALWPLVDKTHFRPLRLVHFLAVAYLAWVVAGEGGRRLTGPVVAVCCKVGQQALGVFMAGIVLSLAAGIVLDLTGRNFVLATAVNLAGCALLVAVAYMADYFKRQPWLALNGTGIRPARGAAGPSPAAAQSHALASRPDEAMADFGPGSRIVPAE